MFILLSMINIDVALVLPNFGAKDCFEALDHLDIWFRLINTNKIKKALMKQENINKTMSYI